MALGQHIGQHKHRRAIGTFSSRDEAEHALRELRDSEFPMDKVSVVAKDSSRDNDRLADTEVTHGVGNKADEGAKAGAITGGALGGLTGLLVGLGFLAIPGIGPVMLAGAGATVLATALSGTAIGAATGGLLGALVGLGIPEERAKVYHDRVAQGHYLVMVEGTDEDLRRAEQILHRRGIQEWGVYDAPHQASAIPSSHEVGHEAGPEVGVEARETESIDLYEERLVADKVRQKTGEVTIGKHVETETVRVETPVERERVIIERVSPEGIDRAVALDETSFQSGEVMRIELYEETPEIQKQVVVREEVNLRKEITQDVVKAEDTVRREEIYLKTEGDAVVDTDRTGRDRLRKDRI